MFRLSRFAVVIIALAMMFIAGCNGSGPVRTSSSSYSLKLLLEKNLDTKHDYLSVEFLRNDSSFAGAFVVVGGDTIRTGKSGRVDTSFTKPKWVFGHTLAVKAVDTSKMYTYSTSVTVPDSIRITNVFPNTRLWQPIKSNPRIEWTGSLKATGYIASIKPRGNGSPAPGQAVIAQAGLTQTFTPTAFNNPQNSQIVPDVYYMHVVAYAPTFVLRPGANYGVPSATFPLSVDTRQISGAVAAAVVSARDSMSVSQ